MSTSYRVFSNDGAGGPVDYSSPIATTASLTWTSSALAYPGDWTFAVRAYDTGSGFEEQNVDARVGLILDPSGVDITSRPNSPSNVSAIPTANGGVAIHFTHSPIGEAASPASFAVYITLGSSPGYSGPAATVPHVFGQPVYTALIPGLIDGTTYTASVRAVDGAADDGGTDAHATFVADAAGPGGVDSLAASVGA